MIIPNFSLGVRRYQLCQSSIMMPNLSFGISRYQLCQSPTIITKLCQKPKFDIRIPNFSVDKEGKWDKLDLCLLTCKIYECGECYIWDIN